MKIMVNGTEKHLKIIGKNGIEWTEDFIENHDQKHDENGNTVMTEEDFLYWTGEVELQEKIDDLTNKLEAMDVDWTPAVVGKAGDRDAAYASLRPLWVEETNQRQIGRNIAEAREAAKLTQTVLAARIGTSQSQIGKYERGEQDMTMARFIEIADALGVSPDTLFKGIVK